MHQVRKKVMSQKVVFLWGIRVGVWSLPETHLKVLLGDFNAKVGRENILKPIGQGSLHQDSNDNWVRLVNFASSKNLVVKSTMFPHQNIHKYTWTSPDGKTHNQIDHVWCRVLLEKLTGLQLVKKFPAFHGTRGFITALTSVHHLSLSWTSSIQSIYPQPPVHLASSG